MSKHARRSPDPAERIPLLTERRNLKMARSAHAYVRGSTHRFYEWLEESGGGLPAGPPVWICGDCHLGNLGPLADAHGQVAVQIRDLDQTVIGNPAHDLIRLGLSLASAARGSDLPGVTTAHMIEEMTKGYESALADEGTDTTEPMPDVVQAVVHQALGRKWKHLARERIEDVKPTIPIGEQFWALSEQERHEIGRLFEGEHASAFMTTLHPGHGGRLTVHDVAYWVKGCSSLGLLRFAVLVGIGQGSDERYCLVDIKEAVAAAAPRAPGAAMPGDHARRVVEGARSLAPFLGERMSAMHLLGRPVVLREVLPQDLKLEIDQLSRDEAVRAARYLASVVGRAHARQMNAGARVAWRRELGRNGGGLDAPPWLWSSVVQLVAAHEAAYLEHCRAHTLGRAA
jgi:uncharacterized protein (DUF2252 family)